MAEFKAQTEQEATHSIDTFLHDMFMAVEIIPELKILAMNIANRVLNFCQLKNIKPKLITFGDIYWQPADGLWVVKPLQIEEQESALVLPPEMEKIKYTMEELPEIARLVMAVAGQLMPQVRRHKVKGNKIYFSPVIWQRDNTILFKSYRKLGSGRMDTLKPEEIRL